MSVNEPLSRTKRLTHAPLSNRHLRGRRGSRADRAAEERTGEQTTGRSAAATCSSVSKQQHEVRALSPFHSKYLLNAPVLHTHSLPAEHNRSDEHRYATKRWLPRRMQSKRHDCDYVRRRYEWTSFTFSLFFPFFFFVERVVIRR